jgi:hypothetical protein
MESLRANHTAPQKNPKSSIYVAQSDGRIRGHGVKMLPTLNVFVLNPSPTMFRYPQGVKERPTRDAHRDHNDRARKKSRIKIHIERP